jgi:hypothetical protein
MAYFCDELFAALVTLWESRIWGIGLREGEEGKGRACEGEETTDILAMLWLCMCMRVRVSDLFYSAEIMYLASCAG